MSGRNFRIDVDAGPGGGGWVWAGMVVGYLLFAMPVQVAGGDDYLEMLESEASKVEASGGVAPQGADADIGAFEAELKQHYRGSYLFYKKLPRRSREKVFTEYSEGASIEDIRKKIMDRFLHKE